MSEKRDLAADLRFIESGAITNHPWWTQLEKAKEIAVYAIRRAMEAEGKNASLKLLLHEAMEGAQEHITQMKMLEKELEQARAREGALLDGIKRIQDYIYARGETSIYLEPIYDATIELLTSSDAGRAYTEKYRRMEEALKWIAQQPHDLKYAPCPCAETDMCITEYCLSCYARTALEVSDDE